MFVDLVGFTTYSEGRDPEEVRFTLSDYFARAEEVIGLYGGVVEKFIGDAVMAVWGTPIAREDDSERAVRAAMELVDAVTALGRSAGADLQARAGVFTGEAAVNLQAVGQGMVAGDMVNTAARLQSVADPGAVLVDRATYLGARKAIAFESVGFLELKGKEENVEAWRSIRVFAGAGGRGAENAIEPAFTGRADELRMIKDLLHSTGREQKPRIASILGVGGIGKSRLVWEFFKYVDGLKDVTYWHQGRSPSYGEGVAFWALAEMVRMRTGIAETDPDESVAQKVDAWLADNFLDPTERDWIRPHILQLIGLEDSTQTQREQLFAGWRRFFERVAEDGPAVLVFEDLHWADPGLIDFIEHLMAWARNSPIFVLTLARPELLDRRPTWGVGQRNLLSVHLEPLTDDDMSLLLKSVAADLPTSVHTEIVGRAEGIPLYGVEMVRMLIDRGDLVGGGVGYTWVGRDEHVAVPDSLHSLIASRLDSLSMEDRLLIQDASVVGKTFTIGSLSFVTGKSAEELAPRLEELARREVLSIDTEPMSPERGQYGFVQSLIREVAYQTLSKADRSARHTAAAEYFASTGDSDLHDVVATHYLEAYKNSKRDADADHLAARARDALIVAALRARSLGSPAQALSLYEMALEITSDVEERSRLLYEAGVDATNAGKAETAIELLSSCIGLLNEGDDYERRADAQAELGKAYFFLSRLDDSAAMLTDAIERLPDTSTRAAASLYTELARVYVFKGDFEESDRFSSLAMPAAERAGDVKLIVNLLITRGVNSLMATRTHESDALLAGALQLAQRHGLVSEQIRASINIAANQLSVHPQLAYDTASEGMEVARRYGIREAEAFLGANLLEAAFQLFRWDAIRDVQTELIEPGGEEIPVAALMPAKDALLGDLAAADEALERIRSVWSDSASVAERGSLLVSEASVALLRGDYGLALATPHGPEGQEAVFTDPIDAAWRAALWSHDLVRAQSALDWARRHMVNNDWYNARLRTLEAGIAALEGDFDAALAGYASALAAWNDLGIPLGKLMCQIDLALLVPGEESAPAAAEAEAFFNSVGNEAFARRLQEARRTRR